MLRRWCGRQLIVALYVGVENGLHFLDGIEPGAAPFDAEVLVEKGAMQALDDAVGLQALDLGGSISSSCGNGL